MGQWPNMQYSSVGSFLLHLQNFFYISKLSFNSQKFFWPFNKLRSHHTPKLCRLPEVKIYDFQKSKYINGSQLPKIKNHHRKSTSGSQKSSPEVDFRKSKIITGNRLPKVKNHHRKSTSGSQKTLRKSTSVYKKIYILFYLIF